MCRKRDQIAKILRKRGLFANFGLEEVRKLTLKVIFRTLVEDHQEGGIAFLGAARGMAKIKDH